MYSTTLLIFSFHLYLEALPLTTRSIISQRVAVLALTLLPLPNREHSKTSLLLAATDSSFN